MGRSTVHAGRRPARTQLLRGVLVFMIVLPLTADLDDAAGASPPSAVTVIPKPASVKAMGGRFVLGPGAAIRLIPDTKEISAIGRYLAERLRPATGFALPIKPADSAPMRGEILLTTAGGDPKLGEEGYELNISPESVTLKASRPAGLFRGIQTIRQLLPPAIEKAAKQPGPWTMPAGLIRDFPRFAWRGAMLDVARHFFSVADVKRYLDLLAYYKINRFHLHLTDDQGWRLEIKSWPRLAAHGGSTQVGGGPGGFYTQEQYAEIVAYAQSLYITVVPEIDLPGHTNAALASYAELNADDRAPALYTDIKVGFSSLCVGKEITYHFVRDVLGEVAALTPGPYIHIGGDEAGATSREDYAAFMGRVQSIVEGLGKKAVGWDEMARVKLLPGAAIQHWLVDPALADLPRQAVRQGAKVIASPADRTYLDMKYTPETRTGLSWAGCIEVREAYDWDPVAAIQGLSEQDLLGVEAALWTETLRTRAEIEFMAFPRLPGIAEIGWSPARGRNWAEYRTRLGRQGPRWEAMGVNFYRSPQVEWAVR